MKYKNTEKEEFVNFRLDWSEKLRKKVEKRAKEKRESISEFIQKAAIYRMSKEDNIEIFN